jgi:hypothetical protein
MGRRLGGERVHGVTWLRRNQQNMLADARSSDELLGQPSGAFERRKWEMRKRGRRGFYRRPKYGGVVRVSDDSMRWTAGKEAVSSRDFWPEVEDNPIGGAHLSA